MTLKKYMTKVVKNINEELGCDIMRRSREAKYVEGRMLAMGIFTREGIRQNIITRFFDLHHTTVISSVRKFNDLMEVKDDELMFMYARLHKKCKQSRGEKRSIILERMSKRQLINIIKKNKIEVYAEEQT